MTEDGDTPGGAAPLTPEDRALAAEYVLRLLGPDARADFEARLGYSRALRDEVAAWEAQFSAMADAEIAAVAPRPTAKAALMRGLFADAEPARPRWWQRAVLWQVTTVGALAVAVGLGVMVTQRPDVPAPLLVGEIAGGDDSLRLLVLYDGADGSLRLTRTDGVAPAGRVLELWALTAPDEPAVSLGLLDETGQGVVTIPPRLRDRAGDLTLAISDEPPGGSPTGQPTGDVRALGALATLEP
jgi:anti-sigma-K factor RskA